jgi:hypothetical protein
MLTDLGYDVFSIGAYTDPRAPGLGPAPALDVPAHPDLAQRCVEQREKHGTTPTRCGSRASCTRSSTGRRPTSTPTSSTGRTSSSATTTWSRGSSASGTRIRHKRVIWRTCGQSNAFLEEVMTELRKDGLQIVRYSPAEERAFRRLGTWARAGRAHPLRQVPRRLRAVDRRRRGGRQRHPEHGRPRRVLRPRLLARGDRGLPVKPAGLQSEVLPGGLGALTYPEMVEYLRHIRAYLYTGTQPASYTLALIEAMMTGVPVVSIGPGYMWVPDLFEGHELARSGDPPRDDPAARGTQRGSTGLARSGRFLGASGVR